MQKSKKKIRTRKGEKKQWGNKRFIAAQIACHSIGSFTTQSNI